MGSSLSDIMKQKLTEYAIRQGKILVDSATGLQVCSADQSDCVLLEEWAKSVSAAYYIFSLVVQQNEKYMKYALQQTDPCSCWAATITTVVAIHRKASFYSEDLIFRCVADKTIPQLSSLRTLIPTVAREPDLTMEEKANLTAQPADNSLEARLEYCFTLTDKVLDKLFFQAYPNQEDYKNAVLNTMMTIKLAYPTELAEQNLYKGLDRMREREERFFRMHHFEYLRINFQDFTAARLKTLLEEKGPLIMALNYLCLVNNGRSLTDKIMEQLCKKPEGETHVISPSNPGLANCVPARALDYYAVALRGFDVLGWTFQRFRSSIPAPSGLALARRRDA